MNDYDDPVAQARHWVDNPGHLHINAGDVRMVKGLLAEIDRLRHWISVYAYEHQAALAGSAAPTCPTCQLVDCYCAVAGSAAPTGDDDHE